MSERLVRHSRRFNADGEAVGMARGRWAVDKDSEGEWIYVDYLVSTVDVEKHLR